MNGVIVARATPPGRGAIGVVRLSGRGAWSVARSFLSAGEIPPRRPTLLAVRDSGAVLDRALVTLFPEGRSYTGEELVEISAHGSPFVLSRIVELALLAGARRARPGEFTQRAFLNGRLSLCEAEAVCDLIDSNNRLMHRRAIARLEEGISRKASALREVLAQALARAEAALDHPEGDLPDLDARTLAEGLRPPRAELRAMAEAARRRASPAGRGLCGEARIAIVGLPNAGKSSLFNALLGCDRAIVDPEPGTTRDALSEACALGALDCVLIDTAGLRESGGLGPAEVLGISRAETALRSADLALLVVDRCARPGPRCIIERLEAETESERRPYLAVLNKLDAEPALWSREDLLGLCPRASSVVEVSALNGEGIGGLCAAASAALGPLEAFSPETDSRHAAALEACLREVDAASGMLEAAGGEVELAAEHLRGALGELDAVAGRTAPEDVLASIFSRFCVGK